MHSESYIAPKAQTVSTSPALPYTLALRQPGWLLLSRGVLRVCPKDGDNTQTHSCSNYSLIHETRRTSLPEADYSTTDQEHRTRTITL